MTLLAISRDTIATQVVDELRRRIVAGQYRGGMKMLQEQIAQEFGVSRSPVREALRQLEAEGLVKLISQKGAEVTPISADEVSEMFELRLLIEPHLLALAVPHMGETTLAEVERIIRQMENAEIDNWGVLNWELHRRLYLPAGRAQTLQILERVHRNIDRYLRLHMAVTKDRAGARVEHEGLVRLCRAGDAERATALLRVHILDAASHIRALVIPESDVGNGH
ncbi:MAG: GntR family transcriptional regulator [Rhizobiales bacterium]|nr:GntR family transcriptional regulator [Hyphomicrobiales bacterium]